VFGILPWHMADLYPDEITAMGEYLEEMRKAQSG
jgi:hypothetical protein